MPTCRGTASSRSTSIGCLHYSFFTEQGLTIHDRGINALMRFMSVRADLFRSIYFHRTVRAIDLTLADLFADSRELLFPGNPLEHLDAYRDFTEWSLLEEVSRWHRSSDPRRCETWASDGKSCSVVRSSGRWSASEPACLPSGTPSRAASSVIRSSWSRRFANSWDPNCGELPLRVDIARHIHRPHTSGPTSGQNYLFDSAHDRVRPLRADELYGRLPTSHRICRIYATTEDHTAALATALDSLIGGNVDDLTNM